MAKQRIRLTEGQLHNIIRRCVNEAVNELDPRTYANYARGREAQGQYDKAKQGREAAVRSFNKQYGYDNHSYRPDMRENPQELWELRHTNDPQYPYMGNTYHTEGDPRYSHGQDIYFNKDDKDFSGYQPQSAKVNHRRGARDTNYEEYTNNNPYHPYDAIGKEQTRIAHQMATGSGEYTKGKGWE